VPGQTVVVGVAPETHLRLMAQALAEARPLARRRVSAACIQAVAHAFAMLGLVSAEGAEAAMTQAGRAPGLRGAGGSEAGAGPGPACSYWDMRAQGRHALAWIPRAVAVGALRALGSVWHGGCSPQLVTGAGALARGCSLTQPSSLCPAESGRVAGPGDDFPVAVMS